MKNDIKLFITDIDGVWTDGGMYYDNLGNEFKRFNTSDSAGVLFLKLLNISLAIITGENSKAVQIRAQKLGISHVFLGVKDKVKVANDLCNHLNISLNEVAFIGDDLNDLKLLRLVGLSATPNNAPSYIKASATWNLSLNGGEGVFRQFVEKYLNEAGKLNQVIDMYVDDNKSLNQ